MPDHNCIWSKLKKIKQTNKQSEVGEKLNGRQHDCGDSSGYCHMCGDKTFDDLVTLSNL